MAARPTALVAGRWWTRGSGPGIAGDSHQGFGNAPRMVLGPPNPQRVAISSRRRRRPRFSWTLVAWLCPCSNANYPVNPALNASAPQTRIGWHQLLDA